MGTTAALVAATALVAGPAQASGTSYVIDSTSSCEEFAAGIGATWLVTGSDLDYQGTCYVTGGTLAAADTVTVADTWALRPQTDGAGSILTNNGTIVMAGVAKSSAQFDVAEPVVNNGTITVSSIASGLLDFVNTGTVSVSGQWYDNGTFTNAGTFEVASAGELVIGGTFTNTCTGQVTGSGTVTGTVTQASGCLTFGGFAAPVDAAPVTNVAKAGAGIPVKFDLGGYQGMDVVASLTSTAYVCQSVKSDTIEETVSTVGGGLSYDAISGLYSLVWKTSKPWAQTCRTMRLTLSDGTVHTASFSFH